MTKRNSIGHAISIDKSIVHIATTEITEIKMQVSIEGLAGSFDVTMRIQRNGDYLDYADFYTVLDGSVITADSLYGLAVTIDKSLGVKP